ncbi:MAG: tRNA uridine-5-carboxymethylaminomethyl(34) synthesis GTPase MnmE [Firmicutes bacterium]|nr:tRNA uridine-5-carboxymethylaminomethyl(34) synthesis GTPase MnmE [Bacillota bacterium]
MSSKQTIVAISTPIGVGGISIIRISGSKTLNILEKVAKSTLAPTKWTPRQLYNCQIKASQYIENGMCVFFKAPFSYTGEDSAEFHIHGSPAIAEGVVRATIEAGAVPAGRGEFTMRAFLNGKMDLTQAEGVADLINSETDAQIKSAQSLVSGGLFGKITQIQDKIKKILAKIEASIDYPEEDIEEVTSNEAKIVIKDLQKTVGELLATYNTGRFVRNGVRVAIVGKPNVGKSTLFNALLGHNRSIVNERAGTTRDTVEDSFLHKNVKFLLIDTAGLRKTADEIEAEGINRSFEAVKGANIVIELGSREQGIGSIGIGEMPEGKEWTEELDGRRIVVLNKCDLLDPNHPLPSTPYPLLPISAKTGQNIDNLKDLLYQKTIATENIPAVMLTNARQHSATLEASEALLRAYTALDSTLDCVSIELLSAYKALGTITGKIATDDIVKQIFEDFCVGK